MKLTVDAPKAKFINKGNCEKITINNAKSYSERGYDNDIVINAKSLSVNVTKSAEGSTIKANAENGKLDVKVSGELKGIVNTKADTVNVEGTTKKAVRIESKKAGDTITVAVKSSLVLSKDTSVVVSDGADIKTVTAKAAADIVVADGASVGTVKVTGTDGVKIENNGTVGAVAVNAKADVVLEGKSDEAVKVTVNAEGAKVDTSVKTDLKLNADAKVELKADAKDSTIAADTGVKVDVDNKTDTAVKVTDAAGKETTVEAGQTGTADGSAAGGSTDSGAGGSSSSGGFTTPSTPTTTKPVEIITTKVTTGSVIVAPIEGIRFAIAVSGTAFSYENLTWCTDGSFTGLTAKTAYVIYACTESGTAPVAQASVTTAKEPVLTEKTVTSTHVTFHLPSGEIEELMVAVVAAGTTPVDTDYEEPSTATNGNTFEFGPLTPGAIYDVWIKYTEKTAEEEDENTENKNYITEKDCQITTPAFKIEATADSTSIRVTRVPHRYYRCLPKTDNAPSAGEARSDWEPYYTSLNAEFVTFNNLTSNTAYVIYVASIADNNITVLSDKLEISTTTSSGEMPAAGE